MLNKNQKKTAHSELMRDIGNQLHQLRTERRVNIEDIYRRFSYYPEYIDRIESGKLMPLIQDLITLANFFDCKVKVQLVPYKQKTSD